jgi:hypothetical protein
MARQRLVKAYGKKGVRKIDVSDEWKKCLRDSPVVSLRSRGPASSLLTSQKARNYPLKEIYPSVDQSSILTSSRSFESSSATFPSPCSSHVDTPQENKTSKNVSYFGRSSSQRKDTQSVSFVVDSENPLPPPNTSTPFPSDSRLIVNGGLEGREYRPGSSADVSGYKCIVKSSQETTPQTRNGSNIVGSNVRSSNRLGTPTAPLSEGRSYEELVSSASSREVSVVLEKMSLLALSASGHQIAPHPQNRSDAKHSNKENVLHENVQMSCLDSPCVTGLLTPEDKEFLHEDSIEFAFHKLRLTPPGKSSTPKEKKQGHNTSDYVSPLLAYLSPARKKVVTDEKKVLSICEQKEPISIDSILPSKQCDILKLGEGVYGEVFSFSRDTVGTVAIKVVPVEGAVVVNGENQKTLKEMLPEMVITKELSLLKGCSENRTSNFIQLHRMTYGIGAYPKPLLDTWNTWNVQHDSENDCPDVFCSDQRYIVFETEHGGVDLEHYKISKTSEAVGLFWQVCGTLAVAEKVTYHDLMHYTLGPTTPSTTCVHPDPVSTSFPLNCCYVHRSWSIP